MGEYIAAFVAGFVSFISPCVLPLIPVYLSFVSGVSMKELQEGQTDSWKRVVGSSVLFVLGFSIIFVGLGASASQLGHYLGDYRPVLLRVGGALVMVMGLVFVGAAKIPFLQQERKFHVANKPAGFLGPIVVGMAFGFGWTPCVGPFLGTILSYAADSTTVTRGMGLLLTYSLGLGLPLLLTALAFSRALVAFQWIKRHYGIVNVASGSMLILMGALLLTNRMTEIQGRLLGMFAGN